MLTKTKINCHGKTFNSKKRYSRIQFQIYKTYRITSISIEFMTRQVFENGLSTNFFLIINTVIMRILCYDISCY